MLNLPPFLHQLWKYAAVGLLAMSMELLLLNFLIYRDGIYYLYASIMVSGLSLTISFILRKLWVFEQAGKKRLTFQIILYVATLLGVVALNTSLVSLLVENFSFLPVPAQFCASLFSGFLGFLINRSITFGQRSKA